MIFPQRIDQIIQLLCLVEESPADVVDKFADILARPFHRPRLGNDLVDLGSLNLGSAPL